jgi:hypothetical protein
MLEELADDLQGIIDANPGTPVADKANNAIAKLDAALEELTRDPPDNPATVGCIEGAVAEIEAAMNEGLDLVQGTELMNRLAGVARQLAADAIEHAVNRCYHIFNSAACFTSSDCVCPGSHSDLRQ